MPQRIRMKYGNAHIMVETDESELSQLAKELEDTKEMEHGLLTAQDEKPMDKKGLLEKIKGLIAKPVTKVDQFFDELLIEEIVQNCNALTKAFVKLKKENDIPPSKAHAEFGLKFSSEGNIYVTKVSGEGNFKISVDWDLK